MERKKPIVAIIIQARMRSTRLPGKVLKSILGRPMLSYLIERIKRVKHADQIVIATTTRKEDHAIFDYCVKAGIPCYRGDEENVLERYLETAKEFGAEVIVRITADCPLIDPAVVDLVIERFLHERPDYAGNTLTLTYPRGMDTEVFTKEALEDAARAADKQSEREHVTLYIYRHPERFKLLNVPFKENRSDIRLTVDTEEDFKLIDAIISKLYPVNPEFSLGDILKLLQENTDLANLNRHIAQKAIKEH